MPCYSHNLHGTNSPPLELSGSHIPLGASSVNAVAEGRCMNIEAILDADQRGQYFAHMRHHDDVLKRDVNKLEVTGSLRKGGPRIMGESLAQKYDTPTGK